MPTILGNMRSLVEVDIGGRNDAAALLVIDHGINLAILLAAIIYKPIELRTVMNITYTALAEYTDLSTYRWLDISRVRDITNNYDLRFIPFVLIDRVIDSALNIVKYYSLFGTNFYLRKIPAANTNIQIYYLKEPIKLIDSGDLIPFEGFDGFIRTITTATVFAAFEEADAVNMWNSISSQLINMLGVGADIKSTFGTVKSYLDQIVNIAQGQGAGK